MSKNSWLAFLGAFFLAGGSFSYALLKGNSERAQLCTAERAFIVRRENQTRVLIARGYTFGLPKSAIPQLLAQSEESEHQFLSDLNCH